MNIVKCNVFIFRRDLRIDDNMGLLQMCTRERDSDARLLLVFVLCAEQADARFNRYHSSRAVDFMMAALEDLQQVLPNLVILHGHNELDGLRSISDQIGTITFNEDVTPYARKRDDALRQWCAQRNIPCYWCSREYSLLANDSGMKPYQVFSPFHRRCMATVHVPHPVTPLPSWAARMLSSKKKNETGKRATAVKILERVRRGDFDEYESRRDNLGDVDATTHLSAHLKFGSISIRELYHAAASKKANGASLIRQLYWRAFYDQLIWHFPHMLEGKLLCAPPAAWGVPRHAPAVLTAWKTGRTGEPLVDAAMRLLADTGCLPNRARMVVASYLIWNLRLDWRDGEHHFATQLVDYHPSANTGNWQWLLLRQRPSSVMSPQRQADRFDKDGQFRSGHTSIVAKQS